MNLLLFKISFVTRDSKLRRYCYRPAYWWGVIASPRISWYRIQLERNRAMVWSSTV